MFAHGRHIVITGGTFIEQHGTKNNLAHLLDEVAPNALYNSSTRFDPPRCHPNTRRAVLESLHRWIRGLNSQNTSLLWIYGPAGAGKSAILQTLAEECAEMDTLLANFFFSASDATRNHTRGFVATIAYQIADRIPHFRHVLQAAMERDPLIFNKSVDAQLQCLVVEPLKSLTANGLFEAWAPRLVIVDGLDECVDKALRRLLLRAIGQAFIKHGMPLIFVIASRPEQDITHTFNSQPMLGLWVSLVLDDTYTPAADIRLFLEDSFADIKVTHPCSHIIPQHWPGEPTVDALVRKSSGQFLYSSVVIKYISTLYDLPPRRLDMVMGLRAPTHDLPFVEIDALYTHLLSSIPDPSITLDILSLVLFPDSRLGVLDITGLFELERGDVELALAPLSSIITIGPNVQWFTGNSIISLSHASFSDFLSDKTRSGRFHLDLGDDRITRLARQVVKYLNTDTGATATSNGDTDVAGYVSAQLLHFLSMLIKDISLTDNLYDELDKLKLEIMWPKSLPIIRSHKLPIFIGTLRRLVQNHNLLATTKYQKLFGKYIQSLRPILLHETAAYLADTTLTAYMIVSLTRNQIRNQWIPKYWEAHKITRLLQITEDIRRKDWFSFGFGSLSASCSGIITDFLFDPATPGHLTLRREHFSDTALKILDYLCRPRRIPSMRHSRLARLRGFRKRRSARDRPQNVTARALRRRRLQLGRMHKVSRRFRCFEVCELGLRILPHILDKCGSCSPLIEFIYLRLKDIVVIDPWTRSVQDAVSEYLRRVERGVDAAEEEVEVAYYDPRWDPHAIERVEWV